MHAALRRSQVPPRRRARGSRRRPLVIRLALVVGLVTSACGAREPGAQASAEEPASSPETTPGPPAHGTVAPAPSPPSSSAIVLIDDTSACDSRAEAVSFDFNGASLDDFAEVISKGMGIEISIEPPVPAASLRGSVSNVPWDCVVSRVARQVEMDVRPTPGGLELVHRVARAYPPPPAEAVRGVR